MIGVTPDQDEDFEEDQSPRIVLGYDEYLIKDLVLDDDKKSGTFTAIGLNPLKDIPLKPWILQPDDLEIEIENQSGSSDSECRFRFL